MDYKWLAVPAILIVALGIALFLNQPKIAPVQGVEYTDVNGDEYLPGDYVTPEFEGIGDVRPEGGTDSDYDFPTLVSDCTNRPGVEKDRCLLLYSVMNEDGSGCSAMDDQILKDDCFAKAAAINGNESFCGEVGFAKQECYVDVAIVKNDASLCESGHLARDRCFEAVAAGDISLCANTDDMSICGFAVTDNNSLACSSLQVQDGYCYYTIARQTKNPVLCEKSKNARSTCYFGIALETNNASLCENLTDTRDNCVAWVAFNTGDIRLCEQAGTERESCIQDIQEE
ncbi:MAG TPA: hypothetical protein VJH23_03270 [archaeon]|nr:hypothetical protein [archaeon]